MDLVEKDAPINAAGNRRKQRYVISDALLDFYYSYLFRESTARSVLPAKRFYEMNLRAKMETEYLPRRFEQVAKEYLVRKNREGQIQPPFFKSGRFIYNDKAARKNGEVDVVTEDEKGYCSYECKYRKKPVDMTTVHEEEYQISSLGLPFHRLGFFSRSGFDGIDPGQYSLTSLDDIYR